MLDIGAAQAAANYNTGYANSCLDLTTGYAKDNSITENSEGARQQNGHCSKENKCLIREYRMRWHNNEAGPFSASVPPTLKRCFSKHKFSLHFADLLLYLWFNFLHLFVFFVLNQTVKFSRQFFRFNYTNVFNDFLNHKNKGLIRTPFSPCYISLYKSKI